MNLDPDKIDQLTGPEAKIWHRPIPLEGLPYAERPSHFKTVPVFSEYNHGYYISFALSTLIRALSIPETLNITNNLDWLNTLVPDLKGQIIGKFSAPKRPVRICPKDPINDCYDSRVLQWIVDNWNSLPTELKEWMELKDFYAWPDCITETAESPSTILVPMISSISIRTIGPMISWWDVSPYYYPGMIPRVHQFTSIRRW